MHSQLESNGEKIDWINLIYLGLSVLNLAPEDFWKLTPLEIKIMLNKAKKNDTMNRKNLDLLTSIYPDKK